MKKLMMIINSVALITVFSINTIAVPAEPDPVNGEPLRIWSSPDLEEIAGIWAEAYTTSHPNAPVTVVPSEGRRFNDLIRTTGNLGVVSSDHLAEISSNIGWKMVVGRSIIVPVTNAANPYLEEIMKRGISPEAFGAALTSGGSKTWGDLLQGDFSGKVPCYCMDTKSMTEYLSQFTQIDLNAFEGVEFKDANGMLEAIEKDKYALGFCRIVDIINFENLEINPKFSLVPVDLNGNHIVDHFENIYNNPGELIRGAWIGKFPADLQSRIYTVAATQPSGTAELAFMEWLLTDGQQYLFEGGYAELVPSETMTKLQNLRPAGIQVADIQPENSAASTVIIVFAISAALVLFLFLVFRRRRITGDYLPENRKEQPGIMELSRSAPGGLFFDKSHTWTFMEKDGMVRTGIDDFLQHVTGPITKVMIKNPGERIKKGEPYLSLIQHGKKLVIYAPLSGVVKEINSELTAYPSLLNESPYNDGWVYKIEPVNWLKEIKAYVMGDRYMEWLKGEFARLKEFLSQVLQPAEVNQKHLILQDGGELRDCLLECLDPEIWEEFQTGFLDQSR